MVGRSTAVVNTAEEGGPARENPAPKSTTAAAGGAQQREDDDAVQSADDGVPAATEYAVGELFSVNNVLQRSLSEVVIEELRAGS